MANDLTVFFHNFDNMNVKLTAQFLVQPALYALKLPQSCYEKIICLTKY